MVTNKQNIPEEDFTNPHYVVNGMFLLSKWIRENTPQVEHKFKVGDVVVVTITDEITVAGRDCDGTPLYGLHKIGWGYTEDTMRLATEEEEKDY